MMLRQLKTDLPSKWSALLCQVNECWSFSGRVVLLNTQWHEQDDKPQVCVLCSWEFEDVQISFVDQNAAIYEQNRRAQGNYNTLRMIRELEQNSSLLAKCGLRKAVNQVHIWLWYNMTFITYFWTFCYFSLWHEDDDEDDYCYLCCFNVTFSLTL